MQDDLKESNDNFIMKNIERRLKVIENCALNSKTHLMHLSGGDADMIEKAGQFVNLKVGDLYLRRPISVCDYEEGVLTLLYDVVGDGTEIMSRWEEGSEADILAPLGNGFGLDCPGDSPLLIGGGIGIAPLFKLGKDLIKAGKRPVAILGFNTAADVVWAEEFRKAGIETFITTVSGEVGEKGFVTDCRECHDQAHEYFYACGPMPMLKALCGVMEIPGELSLDERMACGYGVCMCCSLETRSGAKRICKEGPVFKKEDLIWK